MTERTGSTGHGWELAGFTGKGYDKGRPAWLQVLWLFTQGITMCWWFPPNARAAALRAFGATIGDGVLIRHRVRIHWPWKLSVAENSWIGEGSWILNLEPVAIGSNVCVSQEVLLCTGSHDHLSPTFEFDNAPIIIEDGVWLAARSTVLRGVTIGQGAVIGAHALVTRSVEPGAKVFGARGTSVS